MDPLSAEEKSAYDLDANVEYFWDKNRNIRFKDGRIVRRLDMTSEQARRFAKRQSNEAQNEELAQALLMGEMQITWNEATPTQRALAMRAVTGSSADMKLFLEECRQVGKLAQSDHVTEQAIVVEMSEESLVSMERALRIVRDIQRDRARSLREDQANNPD